MNQDNLQEQFNKLHNLFNSFLSSREQQILTDKTHLKEFEEDLAKLQQDIAEFKKRFYYVSEAGEVCSEADEPDSSYYEKSIKKKCMKNYNCFVSYDDADLAAGYHKEFLEFVVNGTPITAGLHEKYIEMMRRVFRTTAASTTQASYIIN